MNILIIEETPEIADVYKLVLAPAGDAFIVDTLEKAQEAISQASFQMVLVTYDGYLSERKAREVLSFVENVKSSHPETYVVLFYVAEAEPRSSKADLVLEQAKDIIRLRTTALELSKKSKKQ